MRTAFPRISRLENQIDAAVERFVFRHKILGFLMIFIGMPIVTLTTVCVCTTAIALPLACLFGWM